MAALDIPVAPAVPSVALDIPVAPAAPQAAPVVSAAPQAALVALVAPVAPVAPVVPFAQEFALVAAPGVCIEPLGRGPGGGMMP